MSKGTQVILSAQSKADTQVAEALTTFVDCARQAKEIKTKSELAAGIVQNRAEETWLSLFGERCIEPDTPLKIVAPNGVSASLVVTDRTSGFSLSPEQQADLGALLGSHVEDVVEERTFLAVDPHTLNERCRDGRTVADIVIPRFARTIGYLVAEKHITKEQGSALLVTVKRRVLKPGMVERLPQLARDASVRIADIIRVIGSAVVRYMKA